MLKTVEMFTDGASSGNPGPGGYGVVLKHNNIRKELSAGFRKTTNNRMELMAVIKGLSALKSKCRVIIHSDSKYIVDAFQQGWIFKWAERGWMRDKRHKVENPDLWKKLFALIKEHEVEFNWVKAHNGHIENERCDILAVKASQSKNLQVDEYYELKKDENSLFV
jgi:ribonuclease HI